MAKVVIHTKRIQPAVDALVAELHAKIVEHRTFKVERFQNTLTISKGMLWWKETRPITLEEAEAIYDDTLLPEGLNLSMCGDIYLHFEGHRATEPFRTSIRKAKRIAKAAHESDGVFITLDEDEVAFLKLGDKTT